MNPTFQIGPLSLSFTWLLMMAAVVLGIWVSKRVGRKLAVDPEPLVTRALLVGVVCARLAFVWRYQEDYLADPLSIIDIRDGGWDVLSGFIAAWLCGLFLLRKRVLLRRPVLVGLLTTTLIWSAGSFGLPLLWQQKNTVQLPDTVLSSLDQQPRALLSFVGKPTVVNLWATWCPPCRREMPVLQRAQDANPDIHFVFLNQGETADTVQAFLNEQHLPLTNVLLDPSSAMGAHFGQRALPTTLFFDAQGRLVDTRMGELSHATLAQRLEALSPRSSAAK